MSFLSETWELQTSNILTLQSGAGEHAQAGDDFFLLNFFVLWNDGIQQHEDVNFAAAMQVMVLVVVVMMMMCCVL